MTIADVSVGEKITATKQNQIIAAVNAQGSTQQTGLTVTQTGTAAAIGADGKVSFTAVTELTFYGLSSTFDVYEVDLTSSGTASTLLVQVTNGSGTPNTSSVYDRTELVGRNATASSSTSLAQTSWTVVGFANTLIQAKLTFTGLRDARPTTMIATGATHANPAVSNTANGIILSFCSHRNATGYLGLKFTFSAAQSGSVRIRGTI